MTIEEMIKIAKGLRTDFKCESDTMVDFCNTIIKALEQEPCDDCISRQATVERLCKVADFMNEKRKGLGSPYIMAALFIQDNKDEFPSVTPKEKIGKWIQQPRCEGDEQPDLVCPNCGFKISWWDMGNFCAKCGKGLEGGAG